MENTTDGRHNQSHRAVDEHILYYIMQRTEYNLQVCRTVISEEADVRMGRKDNECGAIGVMRVAGTSGETMQPPAEIL